jgi:predicted nucleic acid-binding protein
MSGEFVDTNVLVYAHDLSAGAKRTAARELIGRLIDERTGLLSMQVLMEFYVTVTSKLAKRLSVGAATAIVEDFGTWRVFTPVVEDIGAVAALAERYRIGFWDAMIIRAAAALDASVIWSEDLNTQAYAGIPLRNPFARS